MAEKIKSNLISVNFLYAIAISEGAVVMAVELLGAKMVAPFYGNSLHVWASVLGLTLVGLAGGYFTGGKLSEKFSNKKTLFYVLSIAAVLVLIMPHWGRFIMEKTLDIPFVIGSIISGMLFILPPLFCLGMISPIIINLISEQNPHPGKISGKVYGISTIGGVFMTFFIAFYLIPELGLKISAYISGIFLAIFPLIYFLKNKKFVPILILIFSVLAVASNAKNQKLNKSSEKILYQNDGIQGQILITDEFSTGKRTLYVNSISQTLMHMPTMRSLWRYIHRIAMYSSIKPAGANVLICGLGGGALVKEMQSLGFNVEVVELDDRIEYAAKKYFGLDKNTNVNIDDARHFINSCKKSYDIIIIDISAGENQPSNVYTVECFKKIETLLKNDGIIFVHYQNVIEGEKSIATRSIGKTILASNLKCKLLNTREDLYSVNEVMFFCSKQDIDLTTYSFERRDKFVDPYQFPIGQNVYINNYSFDNGVVLTDDRPIMEMLHQNTIKIIRGDAIKDMIPKLKKKTITII
jgi:spermidine synthase